MFTSVIHSLVGPHLNFVFYISVLTDSINICLAIS